MSGTSAEAWDGYPADREKRQWHVLRHKEKGTIAPVEWNPERPLADAGWGPAWLTPGHMAHFYDYISAVRTDAEVRAAAMAMREAAGVEADAAEFQQECDHGAANTGGAADAAQRIRALPVPDASALEAFEARVRAEERAKVADDLALEMQRLIDAAHNVHIRGATTGSQWTALGAAIMRARAALRARRGDAT